MTSRTLWKKWLNKMAALVPGSAKTARRILKEAVTDELKIITGILGEAAMEEMRNIDSTLKDATDAAKMGRLKDWAEGWLATRYGQLKEKYGEGFRVRRSTLNFALELIYAAYKKRKQEIK